MVETLPRRFEQFSRFLFDVFGTVETQSGIDHDAVLIDEDVGGQARHAEFRGHITAVKQDAIRQLFMLGEVRQCIFRFVPRVDR